MEMATCHKNRAEKSFCDTDSPDEKVLRNTDLDDLCDMHLDGRALCDTGPGELACSDTHHAEKALCDTNPSEITICDRNLAEMTCETHPASKALCDTDPSKTTFCDTNPTEIALCDMHLAAKALCDTESDEVACSDTHPTEKALNDLNPAEMALCDCTNTHPAENADLPEKVLCDQAEITYACFESTVTEPEFKIEQLYISPIDVANIKEPENEDSMSLPYFHELYQEDENSPVQFTNIPDIEELSSDDFLDKSLLSLLTEVKNEIENIGRATCSSSAEAVDRPCTTGKQLNTRKTTSKTAKKRKKQQQKLQKLAAQHENTHSSRRKFAQTYEDLMKARAVFDFDKDIDQRLTCPVCLEMYHLPSTCHPCGHVFCDICLRRLAGRESENVPCPLCRTVIASCELDREFDDNLIQKHPEIYTARAVIERHSKYRHFPLPYTPHVPLGKRIMRHLANSRNNQSEAFWMSHDWFKFLLGVTAGMCISLLIMLLNHVKTFHDVRDVNIAFLSILVGASVTFLIFKYIKI